jgi:trans-aconitate 2-methyltransferase
VTVFSPTRDWDAATYDRVSDVQLRWGIEVLDRLGLRGDETVLDAGCGTGRVTRVLLERLPRGGVAAVDGSAAMVERARQSLPREVEVLRQDLLELQLDRPVDVVFSNAVFHWISDHDTLFRRLYAALRPGGRIHAQCGGEGNVERFHQRVEEVLSSAPFAEHVEGWRRPWYFSSAAEAERALGAAGFIGIECSLEPKLVTPDDTPAFLATVCLGAHLEQLPEDLREPFVQAVMERTGDPAALDYMRLNISARRP